jgi:hypothetical protein
MAPADAALERRLAALHDATPQAMDALAARVSAARGRLQSAADFDAAMRDWSRNWTALVSSDDHYPGLEVRRYALACSHPEFRAWPDIVATVKILCAQPGLTLDSLTLAAPAGSEAFVEAQITLTARLRP